MENNRKENRDIHQKEYQWENRNYLYTLEKVINPIVFLFFDRDNFGQTLYLFYTINDYL